MISGNAHDHITKTLKHSKSHSQSSDLSRSQPIMLGPVAASILFGQHLNCVNSHGTAVVGAAGVVVVYPPVTVSNGGVCAFFPVDNGKAVGNVVL